MNDSPKLKKTIFEHIKGYLFMLLGCIAYGASTSLFLAPLDIVAGGLSGLAVAINYLINQFPVGTIIIVLNIPILLLSIKTQGWEFVLKCLLTVLVLGIVTDIWAYVKIDVSNEILASLYGGILQGVGIGLFIRFEFSSGGTELLGRLITGKLKFLKINVCVAIIDMIVVVFGTIITYRVNGINNMLYAFIVIFASAKVSEIILVGLEKSKLCLIISDKGAEISSALINNSARGITMINGEGMYTHKNHNVLMTCVKNRQLPQLKQIVYSIDREAFLIVNDSVEVRGKGFQSFSEEEK